MRGKKDLKQLIAESQAEIEENEIRKQTVIDWTSLGKLNTIQGRHESQLQKFEMIYENKKPIRKQNINPISSNKLLVIP